MLLFNLLKRSNPRLAAGMITKFLHAILVTANLMLWINKKQQNLHQVLCTLTSTMATAPSSSSSSLFRFFLLYSSFFGHEAATAFCCSTLRSSDLFKWRFSSATMISSTMSNMVLLGRRRDARFLTFFPSLYVAV